MVDVLAINAQGETQVLEVPKPGNFTLKEIQQMLNSVGLHYVGLYNWRNDAQQT